MSEGTQIVRVGAEEAALYITQRAGIHVSSRVLLKWALQGRVPCLKLMGRYAFSLDELAIWIEAGRVLLEAAQSPGRLLAEQPSAPRIA